MKHSVRICTTIAFTALAPTVAQAHHGLDFLSVQTAHLPERGTGYAVVRMDLISGHSDERELEPAVLYGATDWLSLTLHAHYAQEENESPKYESVAPAAHFRFTPAEQPFAAGLSVEYEFAHDRDHKDTVEIAGLFSYETATWLASANIIYDKEKNASDKWGYAAGIRYAFRQRQSLGIEILGSFESHGSSQMLLGYYGTLSETFSINVGLGTGIDGGPDWTARTAFIWQFR